MALYEDFVAHRTSKLREQKGVSAREMSLAIGQNANYINQVEANKINPSMQGFFYICEYLGITPKDFFDEDSEHPALIQMIQEEMSKLDESSLNLILSFTRKLNGKEP